MIINKALISEVKRRLPMNINPPVTLELLLRQKSVEKLEHKTSDNDNNIISKKIIENFIKNNSSKPFSSLKKKINMRQSIISIKKKLINRININKMFNTPFQIQNIKKAYEKEIINKKKNKKFHHLEINLLKKNFFGLKKNQSYSFINHCNKVNNSIISQDKLTYRTSTKYKTIDNNSNKKNNYSINSSYNEHNLELINDYKKKFNSYRFRTKMKPNYYYNKLHLQKINNYLNSKVYEKFSQK